MSDPIWPLLVRFLAILMVVSFYGLLGVVLFTNLIVKVIE